MVMKYHCTNKDKENAVQNIGKGIDANTTPKKLLVLRD
jgi:hypothetical protein